MEALISIITPCYNSSKFIEETIKSVLNQTYKKWEMLIIDDASTDCSVSIIEKFTLKDNRIKCIRLNVNEGVAYARNKGLEISKGKYICFLDSDDTWHPEKLYRQLIFMEKGGFYLSYTSYRKMNELGVLNKQIINVCKEVNYKSLLMNNVIPCSSSMFLASKLSNLQFVKVGHEDFVFWLSALKIISSAHGLNEPLMYYRVQPNSISSNKIRAAKYTWFIFRKIEHFNIYKALYYFISYALTGLKKYLK